MNGNLLTYLAAALALALSSCGGQGGSYLNAPIPEEFPNPARIEYSGLTKDQIVDIVAAAVNDQGLTSRMADKKRGYVETMFVDLSDFNLLRSDADAYPTAERLVYFKLQVNDAAQGASNIEAGVYYRPFRPFQDEVLPKGHPGLRLFNALQIAIERGIVAAGGTVVSSPQKSREL